MRTKITGTGLCVPERIVTNADLEELMDTSDEWIRQRSGIAERRHVSEGETPATLAEGAARRALRNAGLEPADLDCIIVATLSGQADFPGTSFFLQDALGIAGVPCFDLRAQCSGFLYALAVANGLVRSGQFERVLLVGCEVHSTGLDFSTRSRDVTVLFGDGAGAVILEANRDPWDASDVLSVRIHAEGRHARKLWCEGPGSAIYPQRLTPAMMEDGRHYPKMEGRFVFKHAVTRMPEVLREALDDAGVKFEDVGWFLFHQANLRINELVADRLGVPKEKSHDNIQRFGNCSAASIPMLLAELDDERRLQRGQLVSLTGFGAGFSWGSAVLRW
jgi:3-oxoacyl-[acyl-carrier-protein] synthase-3